MNLHRTLTAIMAALPLFAFLAIPGIAQERGATLVIKAGTVIPVEGPPVEGGAVTLDGAKIRSVGPAAAAPAGARVLDFPGAVAFPGFVDGATFLGARRQRDETASPSLPDLRMADAVDPLDPAFDAARAAGITTFHVAPGNANPIGGRTAVGKVLPRGRVRWLAREAGLKISAVQREYVPDRAPTSLVGAEDLVRQAVARGGLDAFRGESAGRVFVSARERGEVAFAGRLKELFGRAPVLLSDASAGEHPERLVGAAAGFILGPMLPELEDRDRAAAASLARAGFGLGFSSGAPVQPPEVLRLSAAVSVLGGLPKEAAWTALTLGCAQLLGVADHVGSLIPGKDADVLVLTHEPADPAARILLVVQDGEIVWSADQKEGS